MCIDDCYGNNYIYCIFGICCYNILIVILSILLIILMKYKIYLFWRIILLILVIGLIMGDYFLIDKINSVQSNAVIYDKSAECFTEYSETISTCYEKIGYMNNCCNSKHQLIKKVTNTDCSSPNCYLRNNECYCCAGDVPCCMGSEEYCELDGIYISLLTVFAIYIYI